MKKVSVIVPVFNTEEFLEECLNSIIDQTYKNLEIIVVDDASTDNSLGVIEKFKEDNRLNILKNNNNLGVGATRNKGVLAATGDYIYFVDSDDLLHPRAIELLISNIEDSDNLISGSISALKNHDDISNFFELGEGVKLRKTTKVFKNRSVLKILFKKDYLIDIHLSFNEQIMLYSDHYLMYKVISDYPTVKYVRDSRYFKRRRNNPIDNPALNQRERYDKIKDYVFMYLDNNTLYQNDDRIKKLVDRDFINFYRKVIVMYMDSPEQFKEIFNLLHDSKQKLNRRSYSKINYLVKLEIKAILNKDEHKYIKLMNLHHNLRALKRSVRSKRNLYTFIHRKWFMKKEIDPNLIVYESFLGKNFSCNPKYIYEYLVDHKPGEYEHVWIYRDKPFSIKGNPKQVKRFSLKYYYYMAKAKYWVFNSRIPKHVMKNDGNIYLQTWHGTPLKKLVFDIKDIYSANPNYKRDVYIQSRRWDYLVSPNRYSTEIFRRAFKFDKEMLEFGYPRNDILYNSELNAVEEIKEKLKIPKDKKVILYAPTWRDNQFFDVGQYKFELELDLNKLREAISDEYVIILRLHYFIANQLNVRKYSGFAFDLSKYDDIAELYLISDILITDYSSVFFDYANLKRPILFFTYDLEEYRDKIRGLYFDIETEVPGPLLKTTDEVIDSIKNIDIIVEKYRDKYKEFYNKFCEWEDGKASENIVKKVFEKEMVKKTDSTIINN